MPVTNFFAPRPWAEAPGILEPTFQTLFGAVGSGSEFPVPVAMPSSASGSADPAGDSLLQDGVAVNLENKS